MSGWMRSSSFRIATSRSSHGPMRFQMLSVATRMRSIAGLRSATSQSGGALEVELRNRARQSSVRIAFAGMTAEEHFDGLAHLRASRSGDGDLDEHRGEIPTNPARAMAAVRARHPNEVRAGRAGRRPSCRFRRCYEPAGATRRCIDGFDSRSCSFGSLARLRGRARRSGQRRSSFDIGLFPSSRLAASTKREPIRCSFAQRSEPLARVTLTLSFMLTTSTEARHQPSESAGEKNRHVRLRVKARRVEHRQPRATGNAREERTNQARGARETRSARAS